MSSYIIIRLSDKTPVLETWSKEVCEKINTEKYEAVPIMEYLTGLNKKENKNGTI